eukprot:2401540-Rhodomonas_salina.1
MRAGLLLESVTRECANINECIELKSPGGAPLHNCDSNAQCEDTEQSFNCICNTGYTSSADFQPNGIDDGVVGSCYDVDECTFISHNCPFECENTDASFTCTCPPGQYDRGVVGPEDIPLVRHSHSSSWDDAS